MIIKPVNICKVLRIVPDRWKAFYVFALKNTQGNYKLKI